MGAIVAVACCRSLSELCPNGGFSVSAPGRRYSSAVHSVVYVDALGVLMTRHIICAAAIATVARITMVRMMGMFRETNMPRHRVERPTRPPLFRLARSHARVSAANDRE